MPKFAKDTSVSVSQSRTEVEEIVRRYGANQFVSGWDENRAIIGFSVANRQVRFLLPLPARTDKKYHFTEARNRARTPEAAGVAWEQDCRQRWRALALVIKAKLEAVECGITSFDEEFLSHIVMPDGQTVAQHVTPRIAAAYDSGKMPQLLLGVI